MSEFETSYGMLKGILKAEMGKDGSLHGAILQEKNVLTVGDNQFVPKYDGVDFRSKDRPAVEFTDTGRLKSVYLQDISRVKSPRGWLQAEFLTFYASGNLHRVFPVYGKMSGFWSEEEEAELLEETEIQVGEISIRAKISCFCFYESGAVKSLTLWPGETVLLDTPIGKVKTRYGISFYENGSIRSLEPAQPATVQFLDVLFLAFDNQAIGIHGDSGSLQFWENGALKQLTTMQTGVRLSGNGTVVDTAPERLVSQMDIEAMEIYPIQIGLADGTISLTDSHGVQKIYSLSDVTIETYLALPAFEGNVAAACSDCSSCSGCSAFNA